MNDMTEAQINICRDELLKCRAAIRDRGVPFEFQFNIACADVFTLAKGVYKDDWNVVMSALLEACKNGDL